MSSLRTACGDEACERVAASANWPPLSSIFSISGSSSTLARFLPVPLAELPVPGGVGAGEKVVVDMGEGDLEAEVGERQTRAMAGILQTLRSGRKQDGGGHGL